jgi:hypothetical protein
MNVDVERNRRLACGPPSRRLPSARSSVFLFMIPSLAYPLLSSIYDIDGFANKLKVDYYIVNRQRTASSQSTGISNSAAPPSLEY